MEYDLLFTVIAKSEWKLFTESGKFHPQTLDDEGYINCIHEQDLEQYLNSFKADHDVVTLVVIDPLRIQESIKSETVNDIRFIKIQGSLHLDAVIDRIQIGKGKNGMFKIGVKHFD